MEYVSTILSVAGAVFSFLGLINQIREEYQLSIMFFALSTGSFATAYITK